MELWRFLSLNLIIPLVMVVAGICFRNGLPRKVNWWAGYRTPMACKNQETWVFAHKYLSKIWIPLGLIFLIISIGATIFAERGTFAPETLPWIAGAQLLVFFLVTFIPTEIALRKAFDKNGERRR
ncbi:MAG: SdpI family protein [Oscillospiraceae bacterium]|nr:SdpI family protein [Oscillospiraceae bacterium]